MPLASSSSKQWLPGHREWSSLPQQGKRCKPHYTSLWKLSSQNVYNVKSPNNLKLWQKKKGKQQHVSVINANAMFVTLCTEKYQHGDGMHI
jgi:hypothetical protein